MTKPSARLSFCRLRLLGSLTLEKESSAELTWDAARASAHSPRPEEELMSQPDTRIRNATAADSAGPPFRGAHSPDLSMSPTHPGEEQPRPDDSYYNCTGATRHATEGA